MSTTEPTETFNLGPNDVWNSAEFIKAKELQVDNYTNLKHVNAADVPGEPAAGITRMYAKADGQVYIHPAGGAAAPLQDGDTGPQGRQGNQGWQGVVGTTGSQGNQGWQGIVGNVGPQGENPGAQGPQGDVGSQGNQGWQGIVSAVGAQGAQGPTGFTQATGVADADAGTIVANFNTLLANLRTANIITTV